MGRRYQVRMKRKSRAGTKSALALAGAALTGALGTDEAEAVPIYSDPDDVRLAPGEGSIHINLSNLLNTGFDQPDAVINYNSDSQNNLNLGFFTLNNLAAALSQPVPDDGKIGPNNNFLSSFNLGTAMDRGPAQGPWVGMTNAFLGMMVDVPGSSPHFGWVRLSVDQDLGIVFHDLAIESEANQAITAGAGLAVPEPGSLGLLALGAVGLAAWRKRRAQG